MNTGMRVNNVLLFLYTAAQEGNWEGNKYHCKPYAFNKSPCPSAYDSSVYLFINNSFDQLQT